ncbi:O-antigen ligase family protein [Pseudomonadales bacterium]|nr:O-antigen ligase family protein [Pseudomonadales bacterium]
MTLLAPRTSVQKDLILTTSLLMVFVTGLLFQFEILPPGSLPFSARLYYIFTPIVYFAFFSLRPSLRAPSLEGLFLGYLLCFGLVTIVRYGLNTALLLSVTCYLSYRVGLIASKRLSRIRIERLFSYSFALLLCAYTFRFIFNFEEYLAILEFGKYAIWIPTEDGQTTNFLFFASGGWNGEIALIGVLLLLIINNKKIYYSNLIVLAGHIFLFESRVGFLILAFHFLYTWWFSLKRYKIQLFVGAFFFTPLLFYYSDFGFYITERFSIANEVELLEEGRTGRLMLWLEASRLFQANPIGYGPGMAISAVNVGGNFEMNEVNFHNIYLQALVDLGVIGFLLFTSVFVRSSIIKSGEIGKWNFAVLIYGLIGLFQFTGYDPFIWFLLGVIRHEKDITSAAYNRISGH